MDKPIGQSVFEKLNDEDDIRMPPDAAYLRDIKTMRDVERALTQLSERRD
ncbi:MAG: hypothetical protein ABSD74_14420 [Rhizomicrobium sp.]|jgi:hypothetical protein